MYIFWKKSDVISVLHLYYSLAPLWMSCAVKTLCSNGKQIESKCQHRSTVVRVDCAKMTCCIGFSFFWIYTCCCISKEGFGKESWNVGAKTQSTLFENHKGLGLKLIFVSIKKSLKSLFVKFYAAGCAPFLSWLLRVLFTLRIIHV